MSRRKIVIGLDYHSIYAAIQELNKEREWRRTKIAEVTEELARMGAEETGYGTMVRVEETENGFSILAKDSQIAFIEFGAGNTAVIQSFEEFSTGPGTWSSSELGKGIYTAQGYWYYGGKPIDHIDPQRGMLRAEETIIARVREVVERVFKDG